MASRHLAVLALPILAAATGLGAEPCPPRHRRANNAIVGLGGSGEIAIRVRQASGTVHVIVDVNGYFE